MNECEVIGRRYLPVTRAESLDGTCLIDFKDPELKSEVESIVMCEDRCSFYEEDEYKECMDVCQSTVESSVVGSMVVDKKTLEIKESTIPVSCSLFYDENEWGEKTFSFEKQKTLLKRLEKAGCEAMDGGWMHPHEFEPRPVELEEEPAICYIHVKSKEEGGCQLPRVMKILKTFEKEEETQTRLPSFM